MFYNTPSDNANDSKPRPDPDPDPTPAPVASSPFFSSPPNSPRGPTTPILDDNHFPTAGLPINPFSPTNTLEINQAYVYATKTVPPFQSYTEPITLFECTTHNADGTPVRAIDWVKHALAADRSLGLMLTYDHTSFGYIADGSAARFLMVPRALFHDSTSVGWYVHSPYRYSEINWTAYKPSIAPLLAAWREQGLVRVVRQWGCDAAPAEMKFFKGYFLAATDQDVATLLNRATPENSENEDEDEDEGEGVVKSEVGLGLEVKVIKEESETQSREKKEKRAPLWWYPVKQQMPRPVVQRAKKVESPAQKRKRERMDSAMESPPKRRQREDTAAIEISD
ncbi:uncharacterized protein BDZ99DRAFT_483648 [Mytilinidion resinicola]|uniref:Uncharacterized protein n=1 Tax=Mytilinidion resinicola TaxID=574789 RepID=A0A6A6XYP9_9PEZI|nr:uncharacterized protein BDZ99DRAFT_483648 [Mytilinidion resinicola]KAF2801622.1 hypothetical protein BDZ99DRAFT_483648 [Mytilinidion resinicola]